MNIIIFSLVCFICCACTNKNNPIDSNVNSIVSQTGKEIEAAYDAQLTSVGLSAAHGVKYLSLGFTVKKNLSVDEARRIMVHCTELILKNINSTASIRPLLVEYPFPPSRVSISIWTSDGTHEPTRIPGILMSFKLHKGVINYHTINEKGSFKRSDQVVIMHKETFEDAKRIIANENPS